MSDEQLIKYVKQYPVLFDISLSHYRDHTVRNNAWEEIAEQMNAPVEEVKTKWAKLRNCLTNALKRRHKKRGQAASTIAPWKFERQMEFLMPHLKGKQSVSNLLPSEIDTKHMDSTDSELQFSEESQWSPSPNASTPIAGSNVLVGTDSAVRVCTPIATTCFNERDTKKHIVVKNNDSILKEIVDVIKSSHEMSQKSAMTDMDETDYFFLSMCKQLKRLPKMDQVKIKFQLHKNIHDAELKCLTDNPS